MPEDRIAGAFARAREDGRATFVAYLCGGDPDAATSLRAARALLAEGVDILEMGVPFSDPLADGLTNQHAAERALASGTTPAGVFDLVRELRRESEVPIVLYTYYNLVFARGLEDYARRAAEAGVDGVLVLDLPPEEAEEWLAVSRAEGLKTIFIVAPTTPATRIEKIAGVASGFIYYVSREGVTGERDSLAGDLGEAVARVRQYGELPVVVGFGISRAEHVRAVAQVADGVVVGSALVKCIEESPTQPEAIEERLRGRLRSLLEGLR